MFLKSFNSILEMIAPEAGEPAPCVVGLYCWPMDGSGNVRPGEEGYSMRTFQAVRTGTWLFVACLLVVSCTAAFAASHKITITMTLTPNPVVSGNTASCTATGVDNQGHNIIAWHWRDVVGGSPAGGTFSPSAAVQNPTYLSPSNNSDTDLVVQIFAEATCDGSSQPSYGNRSQNANLTIQPIPHTLTVTPSASPGTVASGGTTSLTGSATDSRSAHSIVTWSWDDGGAGGSFSPSASLQNPGYTAAANTTDSDQTVTLTLSATCDGPTPLTNSGATTLTVNPVAHTVSVGASAAPGTVVSGGTTDLTATWSDSRSAHTIATWSWDDGGAGGSFSPSAAVQNPSYAAAANLTDSDVTVTLTVTATCDGPIPLSDSDSTMLTVNPVAHTLDAGAACAPDTVASGGMTSLTGSATDSRSGHSIATWSWDDGGAGGSFAPSADVQSPDYTAPSNLTDTDVAVTLTVTATCDGPSPLTDSGTTTLTVNPVPHTFDVDQPAPSPVTVASGGTTDLGATSSDSQPGHSIATWAWDDGGAGGSFSPSAAVQNPSYTAPANTTDSDATVTLTVTATCDGPSPLTESASASLTVNPVEHSLSVSASATPGTVASGGSSSVSAAWSDSRSAHTVATWAWDDGGAGGSFSPSAAAQNPTYTAPVNLTDSDVAVTLTVTATCDGPSPLTESGSTGLTVQPVAHTVSAAAAASPDTVASGGTTSLSATATDSRPAHSLSYAWDDGGAGGSFAPSASVQNPTYTAAANTTESDRIVTLTVTATCGGPSPISNSGSTDLTVHPVSHTLSVTASASPGAVASGGSSSLTGSATDSRGHSIATWSWSSGGAGGSFSPSSSVQNPTYTAAANTTGSDRLVTLTVTATCGGSSPISNSGSTSLTVHSVAHAFTVTAATPSPNTVASAGSATLGASSTDSLGHGVSSWSWEDGGAGGSFSPSASVQNPTYTAAANSTGSDVLITLTVTGTCNGAPPLSDSDTTTLTVQPGAEGHAAVVSATLPTVLEWGESAASSATFRNLDVFSWDPADGYQMKHEGNTDHWGVAPMPLGSTIAPSGTCTFNFTVVAPPLTTVAYPLPVLQTTPGTLGYLDCGWEMALGATALTGAPATGDTLISRFPDIQPGTAGAWARFYVEECAGRAPMIVGGYSDGTYRPTLTVDRGSMAVFMQRALKLDLPSYQRRFSDVPSTYWAVAQIEALAGASVVGGYSDGTYRPAFVVTRDAMAVYVARGLAGGDSGVPAGPGTASFWAYKYVEYAKDHSVVGGYSDGTYRPTIRVTRDQMSVFVYRAFVQPTGCAVALGGPDVTAVVPGTADYEGWASRGSGPTSDPGYAYVTLDAVRLADNLAYPAPGGTCEVTFELRSAAAPNTPATGDYLGTVSLTRSEIEAAHDAAVTSGTPYCSVSWDISAGLTPGSYVLVVSVEDGTGAMRPLARRAAFTITP